MFLSPPIGSRHSGDAQIQSINHHVRWHDAYIFVPCSSDLHVVWWWIRVVYAREISQLSRVPSSESPLLRHSEPTRSVGSWARKKRQERSFFMTRTFLYFCASACNGHINSNSGFSRAILSAIHWNLHQRNLNVGHRALRRKLNGSSIIDVIVSNYAENRKNKDFVWFVMQEKVERESQLTLSISIERHNLLLPDGGCFDKRNWRDIKVVFPVFELSDQCNDDDCTTQLRCTSLGDDANVSSQFYEFLSRMFCRLRTNSNQAHYQFRLEQRFDEFHTKIVTHDRRPWKLEPESAIEQFSILPRIQFQVATQLDPHVEFLGS